MKKNLVFVAMVAALLVACSKDDVKVIENDDPLKINLNASISGISVQTKSTGVVGGIEGTAENVWNNQTIYVSALCNFADGDANVGDTLKSVSGSVLFNQPAIVREGKVEWTVAESMYYPSDNSAYGFYAYHVDDAAGDNPIPVKDEKGDYFVPVTINGSQDLMTGKAVLASDVTDAKIYERAFSAYTSRRSIIPNLTFNHVLKRFQFQVIPGAAGADTVSIDSIAIFSRTTGSLYFAKGYNDSKRDKKDAICDSLAFDETLAEYLNLQELNSSGKMQKWAVDTYKPAKFLEGVEVLSQTKTPVGESLIVEPVKKNMTISGASVNGYALRVCLSQEISLKDGTKTRKPFIYEAELKTPNGVDDFEKAHSYMVNIVVYGLQEIKINTTLSGWKNDSDDINIDQDNF